MCGIAGLYAGDGAPPDFAELRRMVAMLGHRGPDGYGLYRDDRVGLAHARLALVDLAGGAQPLAHPQEPLWLCFNGEIFNYIELRRALQALGHRFRTDSDSEVILHCYARWGAECWSMLNGQFAFALWDAREQRLWLVRDRLGILPLHYARLGKRLYFASEAKALFASGRIVPELDAAAVAESFCFWSVPAPRTVFRGVEAVQPATALQIGPDLEIRACRYWEPRPALASGGSLAESAERLEAALRQSIDIRLRADVPVGAYVSGGLDSSVIGALAAERVGSRLTTFGISFADARFDESAEQRRMAAHLGTSHHEAPVSGEDIAAALEQVVWHCEMPLLRASPVPLYLLAGRVHAAGIKAVLSGEGADELLAGYAIFGEDQIRRFWARRPESAMRPALFARIHPEVDAGAARGSPLWLRFFARRLGDTAHPFYSHLIRWENNSWCLRLLASEARQAFDLERVMADLEQDLPAGWRRLDPLLRAQLIEMRSFMTGYLLSCQGDRVAMAHGVEVRYPFLDPELVELCLDLPAGHKRIGLRDKLALRRVASAYLPREIARRPKQPFRAPILEPLLASPALRDQLARPGSDLLDAQSAGQLLGKLLRPDARGGSEREAMGLIGMLSLGMLSRAFGAGFAAREAAATARLDRAKPDVLIDHSGRLPPSRRVGPAIAWEAGNVA